MPATPNSIFTRFALYDEYTDGEDDIDLYIYGNDGSGWAEVGSSGSGTSREQVDFTNSPYLEYFIFVHGWETDGPDAEFTLFIWEVEAIDEGNLSIDSAPASGSFGGTGTVAISWTSLSTGEKYLGAVIHANPDGVISYTVIAIFTD